MPLIANDRRSVSDPDDSVDEMEEEEEEVEKISVKAASKGLGEDEDEDDEDDAGGHDDGGEGEPEYVVEKILNHKYEGGVLKYLVKWQGYESKADQTWEPEDTLEEVEALEVYIRENGRPTPNANKRGRKSTGGASTPAAKKNKVKEEGTPMKLKQDSWDPPSGSWENDILIIETLERSDEDELICYVQWVNGRKSQHPTHVIYQKCPQKMLKFYESHLVFRDSAGAIKSQQL